jgi:hypothetical protein
MRRLNFLLDDLIQALDWTLNELEHSLDPDFQAALAKAYETLDDAKKYLVERVETN